MEKLFTLTSKSDNTVSYDLGDGPLDAESTFYAASHRDDGGMFLAIEHRSMSYFGTRLVRVPDITVNGVTFVDESISAEANAALAVQAINALDLSLRASDVFGSLAANTNIKSLGAPTVTMPQQVEDGDTTVTKTLATTDQIPEPFVRTFYDITDMFDFPSEAEFLAQLIVGSDNRKRVDILAVDTTGVTSDLIITAQPGYGSNKALPIPFKTLTPTADWTINNRVYNEAEGDIYVVDETTLTPTTIHIPKECNYVNISYFPGASSRPVSHYVDSNGIMYRFSAADTPLSAFTVAGASDSAAVTINGVSVIKNNIREIVFGDDYTNASSIPTQFLYGHGGLTAINLQFGEATTVGVNVCAYTKASRVDISDLKSVTAFGNNFCYNNFWLRELQIGSLDFSTISLGVSFCNGISPNGIIRANTLAFGEKLQVAVPVFATWSVQVNETAVNP